MKECEYQATTKGSFVQHQQEVHAGNVTTWQLERVVSLNTSNG